MPYERERGWFFKYIFVLLTATGHVMVKRDELSCLRVLFTDADRGRKKQCHSRCFVTKGCQKPHCFVADDWSDVLVTGECCQSQILVLLLFLQPQSQQRGVTVLFDISSGSGSTHQTDMHLGTDCKWTPTQRQSALAKWVAGLSGCFLTEVKSVALWWQRPSLAVGCGPGFGMDDMDIP